MITRKKEDVPSRSTDTRVIGTGFLNSPCSASCHTLATLAPLNGYLQATRKGNRICLRRGSRHLNAGRSWHGDQAAAKSSVPQPRWDLLANSNRLQNVADSTLGAPAIKVRDQLWDQLTTTESDRDVLSRSCMPKTLGIKAIPQSRRADSNRGPLHYE